MVKKIILTILFICICFASLLLYFVKTLDVDDLDLYYSVLENDLIIYNGDDEIVGTYDCVSSSCFLAYSSAENILDNVTFTDELKKSLEITVPVMGNYAVIYDEDMFHLVDLETNEVLDSYKSVKYLDSHYIVLKNEYNMYALGYFNNEGITLITDYIYSYIGQSDYSSNFLVNYEDEYYLINNAGNKVSNNFVNIYNYSDDEIIVKSNNYYYVYNYSGETLLNGEYTMIKLDNDFLYLITNNLLSVYDKEYNNLNEEAINLGVIVNWDSYYVYNDDYKFLYEASVFTKTYENNVLTIYANDEETVINIE